MQSLFSFIINTPESELIKIKKNNSIMSVLVDITHLLHHSECTYDDADKIVSLLHSWLKQSRENMEYDSVSDYINKSKTHDVDNDIITPLNHVDDYF